MSVMWETQSVQERRWSPVSHHRKSVPKHKIQHAAVSREAESKTIISHRSPKVRPARYYAAAEVAPQGSEGRLAPLGHLTCPLWRPTPQVRDPGREEDSARMRTFPKWPGLAKSGKDPEGRQVQGAGVRGAGAGNSTSPLPTGPRRGLGERALDAPQAWALDGRTTSKQGPFCPRLAPAPEGLCRIRGGPGVTFWLTRESGSRRRAGPQSFLPYRFLPHP